MSNKPDNLSIMKNKMDDLVKIQAKDKSDGENSFESTKPNDESKLTPKRLSNKIEEIKLLKDNQKIDQNQNYTGGNTDKRSSTNKGKKRYRDDSNFDYDSWKSFLSIQKTSKKLMFTDKVKDKYIDLYIKKHEERVQYLNDSESKLNTQNKTVIRMKKVPTVSSDVKSLTDTIKNYIEHNK